MISILIFFPVALNSVWPLVHHDVETIFPVELREACEHCGTAFDPRDFEIDIRKCECSRNVIDAHVEGLSLLPQGAHIKTALTGMGERFRDRCGKVPVVISDMDCKGLPLAYADADGEFD